MKKALTLVGILVCALVTFGSVQAADRIQKSFDLPATYSATIQTTACSASPGPQVSVQGALTVSGLNAQLIFRNTGPQFPQEPIVVEQVVVPAQSQVSTPTQSIVAGLGNNPFMWLQIVDAKGRPLTSEQFLGRCEQATFTPTVSFAAPASATADVVATDCSASQGPSVSLDGATELSALTARIIFRNTDSVHPGGSVNQSVSEMMILPAGQSYSFPAQAILANSGPNPLISLQLRQEDSSAVGSELLFGRCSTISVQ